MEQLYDAPRPCNTCPYRKDTPAGIWSFKEYIKLPTYDAELGVTNVNVFHCHQETATKVPTVCKGWLVVHSESVAVRMAMMLGYLTEEQVEKGTDVELYASGTEAAEAGIREIWDPSPETCDAVQKLMMKGIGGDDVVL